VIVDSSALVAILLRETGHEELVRKLASSVAPGVAAPTLVETGIVLSARLGRSAERLLAQFVTESGLSVVSFGEAHWRAAVDAFVRFGKGRHAAALNYGDCIAYATARLAAAPLLCTGRDFSRTDIELA
jgi:ribonuclease VapC